MISIKDSRPQFTENAVMLHAKEHYNLQGKLKALPSERDQNFLLTTPDKKKFVCKIANLKETPKDLIFQNKMIQHLYNKNQTSFPEVIVSKNGEILTKIVSSKKDEYHFRIISYLSGDLFAKVIPHSTEIIKSLGEFIGTLRIYFSDLKPQSEKTYFNWDLEYGLETISKYKSNIKTKEKTDIIEHFQHLLESVVDGKLNNLEDGIIHGDANDYNLIMQNGIKPDQEVIWGLIDFGDLMFSRQIFDLAIAAAYAILDKPNPISTIIDIVKGYNSTFKMNNLEQSLLFPLICMRLSISVCISAYQQSREPENEYLSISERPAWDALEKLKSVSHKFAFYCIRWACGLQPHPNTDSVLAWCKSQEFSPIFGKTREYEVVDLNIRSLDIPGFINADNFYEYLQMILPKFAKHKIGVGRYSESRLMYLHDAFTIQENDYDAWRVIHLGIDLFTPSDEEIFAPLDGEIVSVHTNQGYLDYGPTIILKHSTDTDVEFYTLFGHLSEPSLSKLNVGMKIKAGDYIGKIGEPYENGNWAPHVHIQIILDLLGEEKSFPGVSSYKEREIWKSICPDPNLILKYDFIDFIDPSIEINKIQEMRNQHISPSMSISYSKPLHIVRGYMQYLYSQDGRRYLDAVNNVPIVGHSHPYIVETLYKQASVLNTNTRYLQENLSQYAKQLCSLFPSKLSVCFFVNSGSEANELAIRLAKVYTGHNDYIVVDHGYHGNTNQIIEISPYKFKSKGGKGKPDNVHVVSMPYSYREKYHGEDIAKQYADEVSPILDTLKTNNRGIAAFIAESLPGVGGQIIFPENYLKLVYDKIRKEGGICIADEVQVGFARMGTHYWGFETQDVVPDIVTLGKPIGNGHPIGAVITTKEIAKAFDNGMEFFTTTGGNTVSMAVGKAVLDIIKTEKLQSNAKTIGNYLLNELKDIQSSSDIIGEVRGWGLFIGIEIVESKESKIPASGYCYYIVEQMKKKGVLISVDGPYHNVIKIKPPLVFNQENADELVSKLKLILTHTYLQSA